MRIQNVKNCNKNNIEVSVEDAMVFRLEYLGVGNMTLIDSLFAHEPPYV